MFSVQETNMLIRLSYDIQFDLPCDVPFVGLVNVRPSRLNIPVRYAIGYLGDIGVPVSPSAMDFSPWFEVFLENRDFVTRAITSQGSEKFRWQQAGRRRTWRSQPPSARRI
jgi:hypothetical protein